MGKAKRRKTRRNVTVAIAHIKATFNNTTVTITDTKGDPLCWASAGTCGFKGSRKSTPFAGQCAAQQAAEKAAKFGVKANLLSPGPIRTAMRAQAFPNEDRTRLRIPEEITGSFVTLAEASCTLSGEVVELSA